jgi:hypothetical protein
MKVLVACEESQAVCKAFRERGHKAYSCDIIECSGGHPEWHIQGDVLKILNPKSVTLPIGLSKGIFFKTMDGKDHYIDGKWDMIIAFPPCTHLAVSGARWFTQGYKPIELQYEARDFFMQFANADCDKIVIENPVGRMSTYWRKPDQIINPWQFGHTTNKKTCLWEKGVPPLTPTKIIPPEQRTHEIWQAEFNGKKVTWGSDECRKMRSKTFPGIAKAMAEQWG